MKRSKKRRRMSKRARQNVSKGMREYWSKRKAKEAPQSKIFSLVSNVFDFLTLKGARK